MKETDFAIESVMIHDVPRGGRDSSEMTLTDAPINLDDQLREYFRSKITNSLKNRGVEIIIDPCQVSTAYDAVARIIVSSSRLSEHAQL